MIDPPDPTIADIEAQPTIDLPEFTNDDAVDLGLVTIAVIREQKLNLSVRILLRGDVVFQAKLKDTGADNDPWLVGKAATVQRFGEPSLLVRLRHDAAGTPFEERDDVDHDSLKGYGGSSPIRVNGEVVGSITTSGEPDVVDHATTAEAVRQYLAGR